MNRGRHVGSLADRAARSGVAPGSADDDPPAPARPGPPPPAVPAPPERRPGGEGHGRHCWVRDPPDAPGTWPGLLVEWRHRADGWHGRVAYTVDGGRGPVLVEAWLPAGQLSQG